MNIRQSLWWGAVTLVIAPGDTISERVAAAKVAWFDSAIRLKTTEVA